MKTFSSLLLIYRPVHWLYGVIAINMCILSGCATLPTSHSSLSSSQIPIVEPIQEVPVTRYSRYTLVEVGATEKQQDLLSQVIDVTIPALTSQSATVLEAMQYVLRGSGYQLCASEGIHAFHGFPLPLAHRQLGPITLKEALVILAGPGWQLQADHQKRLVCFTPDHLEYGSQQGIEQDTHQEGQP